MKIGITCYPTYGGSGAVATELGIALAARGHEVHFISYRQPFRLPSFLPGVYFHEVHMAEYPLFEYPPYDLALAVRMHEVVRHYGVELLHCHYAIPHATSGWIAREMLHKTGEDVALVTTLHGTDITLVGQDPSFHAITKFSIERSDRITAVSQHLRAETVNAFQCTGCTVNVIYNFIDPAIYDRARYETTRKPFGAAHRVLMHVSNYRPVKRVTAVIEIFKRIHARVPSRLLMVGDGPDLVDAAQAARDADLGDSVRFLGDQELVVQLRAASDLFLMPAAQESFGLAALDAMAESGVTLLTDAALHARFAEAGCRRVREEFCAERIVPMYEACYGSIAQNM